MLYEVITVCNDVALDDRFQQRPLEPRRIAQMAAIDAAAVVDPDPGEDITAEPLNQRRAFARLRNMALVNIGSQRARNNFV